jgi:hypothetical protein
MHAGPPTTIHYLGFERRNAYCTHQCGTLRYRHLGGCQWPMLRSVPDLRLDLGFRRRLPAILAGRREDEFRVMRDLL